MDARFRTAKIVSAMIRSGKSISTVGVRSAVLLGMAALRRNPSKKAKLAPVALPGFLGPFYLRAGTSDVHTFEQVILNNENDILSSRNFRNSMAVNGYYACP